MGLNSEAIQETGLRNAPGDATGDLKLRWWQDRVNWPRLFGIHLQTPILYDPHESFMSAMDIIGKAQDSDSGLNKTRQPDQPVSGLLQRLLIVH